MVEGNNRSGDPPIVDPWEFLAKPSGKLEIGELEVPPDIALLQFLPTLKYEVGLVHQMPRWFIIKASEIWVPSYVMPENSDILLHSHPVVPDEEHNDGSIPSIGDYLNCSSKAKEFIVSQKGLTQYWPVDNKENRRKLENETYAFRQRFGRGTIVQYLQFLKEIEAEVVVYP